MFARSHRESARDEESKMAEELQDNDAAPNEDAMDTEVDIEAKIQNAMLSRVSHFKEQAE